MNHGGMEMATTSTMGGMAATMTNAAAAATTTAVKSMGGMGYTPGTCRISMLWNWYVIDSCFIARGWHNKTQAQFAGSCIGIILICILLEFVRRAQREYDRHIVRKWQAGRGPTVCSTETPRASSDNEGGAAASAAKGGSQTLVLGRSIVTPLTFRPSLVEQAIRAAFYLVQFAAAYLIMLLAMYYNGYIIICILIGVYIGHFVFGYDNIVIGGKQENGTSCC